jgi:hypothetical protein
VIGFIATYCILILIKLYEKSLSLVSLPDWYPVKLPDFNAWLCAEVARIALPLLRVAPVFTVTPDMLEPDGIHLSTAAGDQFLRHLCQSVKSLLSPSADVTLLHDDVTNLSSDDEDDDGAEATPFPATLTGSELFYVLSRETLIALVGSGLYRTPLRSWMSDPLHLRPKCVSVDSETI